MEVASVGRRKGKSEIKIEAHEIENNKNART